MDAANDGPVALPVPALSEAGLSEIIPPSPAGFLFHLSEALA